MMTWTKQIAVLGFWMACLASPVAASSPQLDLILPRGVPRGGEHELIFHGQRLQDAEEIFVYRPGVTVLQVEPIDDKQLKVRVRVADDCPLGEQIVQVRTRSGISEFRSFFVGALPNLEEAEPNGSLEEAQVIDRNSVVEGIVTSEDVDLYKVAMKAGERLSVEIEALRLGTTLFDPFVAIQDADRFELAAVDDSPLVQQDGVLSVIVPEDGDYYVLVRETSYGGNGNCRYRLHVGTFPRPTAVYPAGGPAGESVSLTFLGDAAGPMQREIQLPAEPQADYGVSAQDENGIAPSPIPFRVSAFGNVLEQEPNNTFGEATAAELPNAMNGVIGEPGDVDCFRFTAKKGQVFDVECFARRLRTGLDPVMVIYHGDGRTIAGNDDSRGPDSYIRFTVPEDGEYLVRIADHLGQGQADYVYRVEFLPIAPELTLSIPRIDRYSQTRQTVFVPRGNRFAVLMNATRVNFGGGISVAGNELPPGMTMHAEPMADNLNTMPIVFEAAEDAPLGGRLIDFQGQHVDANTGIRGSFENLADFVLGPPNNAVYLNGRVDKLAIAVIEEVPFRLEIVQPQSPIVRNGTKQLQIRVHRDEGFNQAIRVEFPFRPPGIGAPSAINIPADQTEAEYTLNANGNAQLGDWPIYAIGQADHQGNAWVASQLATLTVAEPMITAQVNRASGEQGQPITVFGTLNVDEALPGEATVEVIGLPPKSTTETLKVTKDTTELSFVVKTESDVPVGKHKSPFLRVTYWVNGEPVVSSTGGFELQIDQPLPQEQPAAQPMSPAEPQPAVAEPPPAAKPLSRLEKLRLEAQRRREAENGDQSG